MNSLYNEFLNSLLINLLHKVLKLFLQSFIVQSSAFHHIAKVLGMIWYEPNFRNYNLLNFFSFYLLCLVCRKILFSFIFYFSFSFNFYLLKIFFLHVHLVLANAMRNAHHLYCWKKLLEWPWIIFHMTCLLLPRKIYAQILSHGTIYIFT